MRPSAFYDDCFFPVFDTTLSYIHVNRKNDEYLRILWRILYRIPCISRFISFMLFPGLKF